MIQQTCLHTSNAKHDVSKNLTRFMRVLCLDIDYRFDPCSAPSDVCMPPHPTGDSFGGHTQDFGGGRKRDFLGEYWSTDHEEWPLPNLETKAWCEGGGLDVQQPITTACQVCKIYQSWRAHRGL